MDEKKLSTELINIILKEAKKSLDTNSVVCQVCLRDKIETNTSVFEKYALICMFKSLKEKKKKNFPDSLEVNYNGRVMKIPVKKEVVKQFLQEV